ncbi:MAG: hypothetical protein WA728_26525 [Xanthobacteraceae bacterium]
MAQTALYDQFFGDSGRLHRSLRFAFMSASAVSALLQGQLDAFHEKIMDFAPFIEGDPPQRLISGLWQVDARMLDVRARPAASGLRCGASLAVRGSAALRH